MENMRTKAHSGGILEGKEINDLADIRKLNP